MRVVPLMTFALAILVAFLSTLFAPPNFPITIHGNPMEFGLYVSSWLYSMLSIGKDHDNNHHVHYSHYYDFEHKLGEVVDQPHLRLGVSESICDDFPPDFPPPSTNSSIILCVDSNGCCNFTTVQGAVDAVIPGGKVKTTIWVNKGIYFEKVIIPSNKTNITLQGQGFDITAIAWNDTAKSSGSTSRSASVSVFASDFIAQNITFMNIAPRPSPGDVGAQAVAIKVSGDRSAFWGCGFLGAQDTLYDDKGRHYFRDCFIQGSIDFIFGNGRSLYENCQLSSIANPVPPEATYITGAITAHARISSDENTGFSFIKCEIGGDGRIYLGRAWRPYSRVVFSYTFMSRIVAPEGWNNWDDPSRDKTIFYGEYQCTGPGADTSARVAYAKQLDDSQALPFLNITYIDGGEWLLPYTSEVSLSAL